MMYLIKNKYKFIKQTCLDLWGIHISYTKLTKAANFIRVIKDQSRKRFRYYKMDFIFTLRKRINFRRQKRFKKEFLLPRLLYYFYLVLSKRTFMKFANIAKKRKGYYIENYLGFIEGRLFMMVYRSGFISNLFMIRYVIERKIFYVDEKLIVHHNSIVKVGQYLWFKDLEWRRLFKLDFFLRFINNVIMWPIPRYLILNGMSMFVLYWRYPRLHEIAYPTGQIDIQLANDYHII